MADDRDGSGRFVRGCKGNPGGLSHRQTAVARMVEGLVPKAVQVLEDCLASPDDKIRLDAAREIVRRVMPAKAPGNTNINVAVATGGGIQETMAVLTLRRLHRQGRISAEDMAAVPALPAPGDAIDVEAVPIEPADEPDELDHAMARMTGE